VPLCDYVTVTVYFRCSEGESEKRVYRAQTASHTCALIAAWACGDTAVGTVGRTGVGVCTAMRYEVSATTSDITCSGVATAVFVQAVPAVRSCIGASASHGAAVRVSALIVQRALPAANAWVAHAICVAAVNITWPQIRTGAL
jgi:hypothetical protein